MSNSITWPKDLRDKCKEKGMKLIAFGCPGIQMVGMTDAMRVQVMSLLYVHFICNKRSFDEALAETKKAYPEHFRD